MEGRCSGNDRHNWERAEGSPCVRAGRRACDHLRRYPEDIALLAGLGLNCYRFSLEWSRIEPERGVFSRRWLAHYRCVSEVCRELGLLPIVTFHHFTNPRWHHRTDREVDPEVVRRHPATVDVARRLGYDVRELDVEALEARYAGAPDAG